jgi:hypothetical protein
VKKKTPEFKQFAGHPLTIFLQDPNRLYMSGLIGVQLKSVEEIICKFSIGCQSWSKWPICDGFFGNHEKSSENISYRDEIKT